MDLFILHPLTPEHRESKVKEYVECHRESHCYFTVYVLYLLKKKKKFKPQQKEYFQLYLEIGELVSVEQARDFFKNT